MEGQTHAPSLTANLVCSPDLAVFCKTEAWLEAYFQKRPSDALLPPVNPRGTPFQQAVWKLLAEIPFGTTVTYGALAQALRQQQIPASARAVGGAVGRNPISIILPCHRVVGRHDLGGYAGGIARKRYLLELEESLGSGCRTSMKRMIS